MPFVIHGLPVSQGIAIGNAHLISHALLEVDHLLIAPRHVDAEVIRLEDAAAKVRFELRALREVSASAQSEVSAFVDLHTMLLDDPMLVENAIKLIRERRCNAEWALVQQMEAIVDDFDNIDDPYLRERKADVIQVVERLVKALLGHPSHVGTKRNKNGLDSIVVAHDLSPADTIHFKDSQIAGFVTDVGGATSHTAIVARSLGIPAVVGLRHIRQITRDGDIIIIDGARGVVIIDPDERVLEEYRLRRSALELERSKLKRLKANRAATIDGHEIALQANIELPRDVPAVKDVYADGIGLFRTEFLFMNRDTLPNEEEQFEAYKSVARAMGGKPVVIRTLDIGADKALSTGGPRPELNPALGLRAIRFCLAEPQMFLTQLRAILRASLHGKIKILIPMVAHAHEVDAALGAIEQAKAQLRAEKIKFDEDIKVGGMIEIPAAALALGIFVRRLNFLSIGTNDLIQYTLAIDRTDEAVAHLYDPLHPAILRLIAATIHAGAKADIPVSVCGEMAGDKKFTRLLLGMGLRQFSMHPTQILEVKQEILRSDAAELAIKVGRLLKLDEPDKIREAVDKL
ncbi:MULTISPECIES: phosphoenolpyruvate--protein phosphotransferase [Uliginosibacterium]|uniref:Phosphoenolpyruvate-protein phosphotransferase n=1 Tax=Uliginosibacterium aquaticum TaxID=2731212 RepID=A0ABX2IHA5_9RHOO|nr:MULTISPECIES: phosphoenolpyruvate--protein phosphotransferase [Uliginosibacterium]MDO6387102.1 phosphoenolpyruvate--protein phosphotransferase [Uliginosibacterium sp. 31-12]NSL56135.1 phosphoenolpyruvate--protein phosphotransferase [Uliginosibacterium aquaticum]PLK50870.1 phosphoenolpyruvate--protein phosphotransferase [Uliginosibacterium sp. TH139]